MRWSFEYIKKYFEVKTEYFKIDIDVELLDDFIDLEIKVVEKGQMEPKPHSRQYVHVNVIFHQSKRTQQNNSQNHHEPFVDQVAPLNRFVIFV